MIAAPLSMHPSATLIPSAIDAAFPPATMARAALRTTTRRRAPSSPESTAFAISAFVEASPPASASAPSVFPK